MAGVHPVLYLYRMSEIRRQSIISSIIVYSGFALGILNTYLFTREGGFTKEQYGLTGAFMAIGQIMFSVASLGMPAYIYKFRPYYRTHIHRNRDEQLTLSLSVSMIGFLLVLAGGLIFKGVINQAYANSPQVITYYYWLFPFGFGMTLFSVLEAYGWATHHSVMTNFLRELLFRLFITALFALTALGILTEFDQFVHLYAFTFLIIAFILVVFLLVKKEFRFTFSFSRVTIKFKKKIIAMASFFWTGGLVYNVASVFDTIVIAAILPNGLAAAGIYTLGQYLCSLIQAPQRAIISASVGPLAEAWKVKDHAKIQRIYQRSSINQLIFASAMFCLLWLNFMDGIETFHIQSGFKEAFPVFIFIGLMRVMDMGTGINSQIIGTSTYWRFEFITGILLLALNLPLSVKLTQTMGVIGPAIANLIAFTIYNFIRFLFLYRKFGMQPFTPKTVYTLLTATVVFILVYYLFNNEKGVGWIIGRTTLFLALYLPAIHILKLTPDWEPVMGTVLKRMGWKKKE